MAYNQTTGVTTDGPDGGVFDLESSESITSTNQAKDILDAAALQAALSAESAAESAASAAAALVSENNSDTSEAAALAAQAAAETAQGLAEDAQLASETAQGLSEAAQSASETAQGLSEDAQLASEQARDSSIAARDAAIVAQNAASSSAGAALTSANNASASATTSETNKNLTAGYLASVEAIFDNFDDIYLGAKASDPAVDNDGDPLNPGDVYWNTTVQDLRFYNGATWEAPSTAAATSAAAALSSELAAALSEAAALASQNAASVSESNSNLSAIASEASRQASDASAAAAAVSESNAASSESNAATSETNAAASELAAANSAAIANTLGAVAVGAITYDMTGFVNRTDSTLSFVEGTRTLTLTPVNPTAVYYRGTLFTVSSPLNLVITNTSGGRYVWFNPDTQTLTEGSIGDYAGIITNALVAYVYWDATNQKAIIFGDERHAAHRDTQWHLSKHIEQGAVWRSGGTASYTINDDTAVGISFVSPIVFADEDLIHTITHSATPTNPYEQVLTGSAVIPTLYLSGSSYVQTTASAVPWVAGTALARYNPVVGGVGSLVDVTTNYYMSYWIVATNDSTYPIKAIMGHVQSNKVEDIEAEVFDDYGLPVPELVPMYHVILRVDSAYTNNTPHVVINSVFRLTSRETTATSAFSPSNHNTLAGRGSDDQHPISAITNLQTSLDSKINTTSIGVTVQPYNADYVVDAAYVHTDNNFTTAEKTAITTIEDTAIAAAISMAIALG